MTLTNETYFSSESDISYMSATQFKNFAACESGALAKLRGEWIEVKSTALLVGSYVDAHFEGTLDIFKAKNPEIFTKAGTLKCDYSHAEVIIQRIERDPLFSEWALTGDKQVVLTGQIEGVPFKIKIDSYRQEEAIIDLKVIRDFEPVWVSGKGKIPFVEAWGYDIQGAIYQAIEGNNLPFIIAAATKEKPEPDIAVIQIPQSTLDAAMNYVKWHVKRYHALKQGTETPTRCERCDYCKATKVLDGVVDYRELYRTGGAS